MTTQENEMIEALVDKKYIETMVGSCLSDTMIKKYQRRYVRCMNTLEQLDRFTDSKVVDAVVSDSIKLFNNAKISKHIHRRISRC